MVETLRELSTDMDAIGPTRYERELLLFDKLPALQVSMPLQMFLEWQRNLTASEMRRVVRALMMAQAVTWEYAPARIDLIR